MTTSIRSLAVAILLAFLVGACQPSGASLSGRAFLSVGATDHGAPRNLAAGTRVRLDFNDNGLSGSAGCNSFGGDYRIDGGRLIVDDLYMTEMACDADRMAQEAWVVDLLGARPAITVVGDDLTLDTGAAVLHLRDRRVVEPDLALAGPTWVVESIIAADAVSSLPNGLVATIVFHADGTVDVNDGCNTGSGRWAAVGPGIEIAELGMTKKACPGAAGELETTILETLRSGTLAAAIDADQLTLRAGARGLQLRAG